jgi:hypothetical protein
MVPFKGLKIMTKAKNPLNTTFSDIPAKMDDFQ